MTLFVHEVGPEGAPAVVFLHGAGVAGWIWRPQIAALSAELRCLVPDLPEHGKSRAEGPFSIEDAAARVADLIRARAPGGRAHVVGLSLGAQIIVALLSRAPEVVDHAICTGTNVRRLLGRMPCSAVASERRLRDLGSGYWQLGGGAFELYVAEIDVVAEVENDDLLRLFGHGEARTVAAERWLAEQVGAKEIAMALHDMEGFDEVMRKLLGNLPPEQVLLALPVEVLAGLSEAYLASLSEPMRAAIRARLAEPRARASRGKARKPSRVRRRAAQAPRG